MKSQRLIGRIYDFSSKFSVSAYKTILEPDRNEPDWWAGAPSVIKDQNGKIWLAARMREGYSPRGFRGYEIRILNSNDGFKFNIVKKITREECGMKGFERPSILLDPKTGKFKLYLCGPHPNKGKWHIMKLDDVDDPKDFDPKSIKSVVDPDNLGNLGAYGVKDPFVIFIGNEFHMFLIGGIGVERALHLKSADGEKWELAQPNPILENIGWHNYYTRPACVLPLPIGYLMVYEGSHISWYDPSYNIASGLAYSLDLYNWIDLSPDKPLFTSQTPGSYQTLRYSDFLVLEDRILFYYEAARKNNTNEIRVSEIPLSTWKGSL
ncbi:MAG: hypothetical protein QW768_02815 [Thermoproteota archaeon]